ncbi:MAG: alpha/beta fold hydrolase [Anaerolineae bacterium]|nr:alpha/beta fold hydrolase [Anaerolineae bacterium]
MVQLEVITRGSPDGLPGAAKPTPLLFVHGAWHGAWCWDEHFLPYFAAHGYIVHALSLRGHGKSEGRIFGSRIRHYAQDVAQVAASLPTPPIVIGHSMGGFTVQKYLETHSETQPIPAAVLIASCPPGGLIPSTLRTLRTKPLTMLKVMIQFRLYPLVSTPEQAHSHLFSSDFPVDRVAHYQARLSDESMLAFLDMMGLDRVRVKRITARNIPIQVIGAGSDTLFLPREVVGTARAYGTVAEILPDIAHDMMLEDRWQEVADRILAWLAERGL